MLSMTTRLAIGVIKFESEKRIPLSESKSAIILGCRVTFTPVVRHLAFIVSLRSLQCLAISLSGYFIRRFAFNEREAPAKNISRKNPYNASCLKRIVLYYTFIKIISVKCSSDWKYRVCNFRMKETIEEKLENFRILYTRNRVLILKIELTSISNIKSTSYDL